jgi:hypothetical protein
MSDHTGWPPGLLQDDDRKLSRWFAGRPGARGQVDELHGLPELAPQGSGIDGEARVRTVLAWPALDVQQPAEDVQQASGGQAGGDGGSGGVAISEILDQRGQRYGKFCDHAGVAQRLKSVLRNHMGQKWDCLADDQKEALEMIAHKLARIANGDPDYADSWVDIAGYAKLVADRLEGVSR